MKELMVGDTLKSMGEQETKGVINDELERLGFKTAAKKVSAAKKMKDAYKNYLFVTQDKITAFNKKLRDDTKKEDEDAISYKRLAFISIENYSEIPPAHVLTALAKAKEAGCFDTFEIAKIEWHKEVKDPILFGKINGCTDYFFISQWDDDVRFEDILFMEK